MNRETEGLREGIAKHLWEATYPDGNTWETLRQDHSTSVREYLNKANQILHICKDDGLRWYDGKNDRFVEIEL